jgi:hypothetical protein
MQTYRLTDMNEPTLNFHKEVGDRLVNRLPRPVGELFHQWRSEWGVEIRGIQQGDNDEIETNALVFQLPNNEQMERFNSEFGGRLFDLFSYFHQQKTLAIDVVFISASCCGVAYSWMVSTGHRFPVPTQWREAND